MQIGDTWVYEDPETGEEITVRGTPLDTSAIYDPEDEDDDRPFVDEFGNTFAAEEILPG